MVVLQLNAIPLTRRPSSHSLFSLSLLSFFFLPVPLAFSPCTATAPFPCSFIPRAAMSLELWLALGFCANPSSLLVSLHPAQIFVNSPFIKLSSNYLIWVCHLFSTGIQTNTLGHLSWKIVLHSGYRWSSLCDVIPYISCEMAVRPRDLMRFRFKGFFWQGGEGIGNSIS